MTATLVIVGGEVLDGAGRRRAQVTVVDGVVTAVGEPGSPVPAGGDGVTVLDATGCVVAPGFVDLHTHLREPGREEAETIETGARAAARGGFTAVVAMPNTEPAVDDAASVRFVLESGRGACCDVRTAAAITTGRAGARLTPMAELAGLGVRIFTDDGCGVQDDGLMRRAMEYAAPLGVVLAQHCEVESLARGGHMHEGTWSSRLGLAGIPAEAEELMVARDLALARRTGAACHLQHLSTAGAVELVRAAKAAGVAVTCEVTPHHLLLTDAELATFDPVFKVNPPLRTAADVDALRAAVADGTIDAIATDHAPHAPETKELPIDEAPCGMLGLETAFAVAVTALVVEAGVALDTVVAALSWRPAAIAGLAGEHGGPVAVGRPANLCVLEATRRWVVDADDTASRSRNNPYAGRELTGRVRHTVLRGEPVVIDGVAQR